MSINGHRGTLEARTKCGWIKTKNAMQIVRTEFKKIGSISSIPVDHHHHGSSSSARIEDILPILCMCI